MEEKKIKSGEVIILSKEEDLPIILEALEILIEDIENDMIDNSWNSQYRQELLVKLNELYERL
tara:strand:- start:116 stop:304 length:189 start_codon:yes stop_codon:yes gene_type:complete